MSITHVLAFDQAEHTGWCLKPVALDRFTSLRAIDHGVARVGRYDECAAVVRLALETAVDPAALLVMFEDHSTIPLTVGTRVDPSTGRKPRRGTAQILGLGAARGYWSALLDAARHPSARRDKVEPGVWRRPVLGTSSGTTEQLKARAVQVAGALLQCELGSHDQAEAVCIAEWAARDGVRAFEAEHEQRAKRRTGATTGTLELEGVSAADVARASLDMARESLARASSDYRKAPRRKPFGRRW